MNRMCTDADGVAAFKKDCSIQNGAADAEIQKKKTPEFENLPYIKGADSEQPANIAAFVDVNPFGGGMLRKPRHCHD